MAVYVPLAPVPLQFLSPGGEPLTSGTLSFYLSGTSTPANLYSDTSGTSIGTSLTINSSGYLESGGNVITLFRDTAVNYKLILRNSSAATIWTADGLTSVLAVLASTAANEGASLIGLRDSGGNYNATNVENALAELASTSAGEGASIIGIEDSGGYYTADDVEGALAEIAATSFSFTGTLTGMTASTTGTVNGRKVGGICTLYINSSILGTSNTTAMSMTGIPSAANPANTREVACYSITDGVAGSNRHGRAQVSASNVIVFDLDDGAGTVTSFANSGSKGLTSGWTITYPL